MPILLPTLLAPAHNKLICHVLFTIHTLNQLYWPLFEGQNSVHTFQYAHARIQYPVHPYSEH